MSRFFSENLAALVPYVPGEQPKNIKNLIKLNTNESPYPPPESVLNAARDAAAGLNLYCDTEARALTEAYAGLLGVTPDMVLATNGSDEILYFAFLAFGSDKNPFAYPDVTYGFYPVFSGITRVPGIVRPLREDFTVDVEDYLGNDSNVVLANPNAPTGIALPMSEIERIVRANPDHVVVIDEAYADFGQESAVPLTKVYKNLLVTHTFSKSRSLAGGRLGFGIACPELIQDLKTVKFSTNPYNVNAMTQAAGLAAIRENAYFMDCVARVKAARDETAEALRGMGFTVLPSETNFLFCGDGPVPGAELMQSLRAEGILVRHFDTARLRNYVRISVGTQEQMRQVVDTIRKITSRKG